MSQNRRTPLIPLLAAMTIGAALLIPTAAGAAPGSFSSGNSTPALTASHSTGTASAVRAVTNGTGSAATLYAQQFSPGNKSNAFYAKTYVTSGEHYGVWGVDGSPEGAGVRGESYNEDGLGVLGVGTFGVYGAGDFIGVEGDSGGVPGDGTFGLFSDQDAFVSGQLLTTQTNGAGDLAGRCTVPANTTAVTCTYPHSFPAGVTPIVVVTQSSPASPVSAFTAVSPVLNASSRTTGFALSLSAQQGIAVTYNYLVVGAYPGSVASAASAHR